MTQINVGGMVTNVQMSWTAGAFAIRRLNGTPHTPKQEETVVPSLEKKNERQKERKKKEARNYQIRLTTVLPN